MFIFQIDPGKILQAQNTGGTSKSIDAPDAALLKSLSANKPGWIDPGPVLHPPFLPEKLLGEIIDLSNALLMDPYHHLGEISKLGKDLAEYTHTEYNLGKVDKLFDFFLRDKSDLTGDGKIDHNDVIKFWKDLDHKFTYHQADIDLNNDKTIDYRIEGGKIYARHGDIFQEVDYIPGVDLKKLSDRIDEEYSKQNPPYGQPTTGWSMEFYDDINGDGKIDYISGLEIV